MADAKRMYRLVYIYNNGDKKIFNLNDISAEVRREYNLGDRRVNVAFTLTELDRWTSSCKDEEQFSDIFNVFIGGFEDGRFVVEYSSGGTIKSLDVVYGDMENLALLAKANLGKTRLSKFDVIPYMRWYLEQIVKDDELFKFISDERYINSHFRWMLSLYVTLKKSLEKDTLEAISELTAKLTREFSYYKNLRGLEIGLHHYRLVKEGKKIPIDPNDRTIRTVKVKKAEEASGTQLPLFDVTPYIDDGVQKRKSHFG